MKGIILFIRSIFIIACLNRQYTYIPKNGEKIIEFDREDSTFTNFNLTVKTNQLFTLKMRGNPTTGYSWFLDNASKINRKIVIALNLGNKGDTKTYIPDPVAEGVVGSGGNFYFQFQGIQKGSTHLVLSYKRPWDPKIKNLPPYTFKVSVN